MLSPLITGIAPPLMIGIAPPLMIGIVAAAGILLAPLASKIVRWRSRRVADEAGTGDDPGSPDRGPGGMKM